MNKRCFVFAWMPAVLLLGASVFARQQIGTQAPQAGDRTGNGSDYVEPLFIQAKTDAAKLLSKIRLENVNLLRIDDAYKTWLLSSDHLSKIQEYSSKARLVFQNPPCNEGGEPRGASYDDSDPKDPRICVSYSYNRMTTPDQAEAMMIHESGHFAKEKDHYFLSEMGTQLVKSERQPANKKESFYRTFQYYVKKSCEVSTALENVKNIATLACKNTGYRKCPLKERGISNGPIKVKNKEWPYYCEAYAIVEGWNPPEGYVEPYETVSRNLFLDATCLKWAQAYSTILGSLSNVEMGMYARCDHEANLIVGVHPSRGVGEYRTGALCYNTVENCNKAATDISGVSDSRFNLSLGCREAGDADTGCKGGFLLSGKVLIFNE